MADTVASDTGSAAMTQALSIAIQMGMFYTIDQSITNEQAAALAILLFPFVHAVMRRYCNGTDTPDAPKPSGEPKP